MQNQQLKRLESLLGRECHLWKVYGGCLTAGRPRNSLKMACEGKCKIETCVKFGEGIRTYKKSQT